MTIKQKKYTDPHLVPAPLAMHASVKMMHAYPHCLIACFLACLLTFSLVFFAAYSIDEECAWLFRSCVSRTGLCILKCQYYVSPQGYFYLLWGRAGGKVFVFIKNSVDKCNLFL